MPLSHDTRDTPYVGCVTPEKRAAAKHLDRFAKQTTNQGVWLSATRLVEKCLVSRSITPLMLWRLDASAEDILLAVGQRYLALICAPDIAKARRIIVGDSLPRRRLSSAAGSIG